MREEQLGLWSRSLENVNRDGRYHSGRTVPRTKDTLNVSQRTDELHQRFADKIKRVLLSSRFCEAELACCDSTVPARYQNGYGHCNCRN